MFKCTGAIGSGRLILVFSCTVCYEKSGSGWPILIWCIRPSECGWFWKEYRPFWLIDSDKHSVPVLIGVVRDWGYRTISSGLLHPSSKSNSFAFSLGPGGCACTLASHRLTFATCPSPDDIGFDQAWGGRWTRQPRGCMKHLSVRSTLLHSYEARLYAEIWSAVCRES